MAKVIEFKKRRNNQPKDKFLEQLYYIEQLYLDGTLDKILIICQGENEKACASSGLTLKQGKEICANFLNNSNEYID